MALGARESPLASIHQFFYGEIVRTWLAGDAVELVSRRCVAMVGSSPAPGQLLLVFKEMQGILNKSDAGTRTTLAIWRAPAALARRCTLAPQIITADKTDNAASHLPHPDRSCRQNSNPLPRGTYERWAGPAAARAR